LLRRHVSGRAEDGIRVRQRGRARELRETEVEDFHRLTLGDHDVAGLDVAMNDQLFVCGREPARDLNRDAERLFLRERLPRDHPVERFAVVVRHGDEHLAIFGFVDVEDRADVGMVEGRRGPRLLHEALANLVVPRERVGKKLQSDRSPESVIRRPVDHPHAAGAQSLSDRVVGDALRHREAENTTDAGRGGRAGR